MRISDWSSDVCSSDLEIDPASMPMTGLSNAAIDHVAPGREAFVASLAAYAERDLVCYRAESPADLADRHAAAWDPLLHWAARSGERRRGQECVRPCSNRRVPLH